MTLLLIAIAWLAGVGATASGLELWWPYVLGVSAVAGLLLWIAGSTIAPRLESLGYVGRQPFAVPNAVQAFRPGRASTSAALWCIPLAVIAIAGTWRFEATAPPRHPGGVAVFAGSSPVTLRGVVVDDPEQRGASQRIVLEVDAYRDAEGWQRSYGRVLVTTRPFPRFDYGDVIELRGELEPAPELEGFDYGGFLKRRGIVAVSAFPGLRRTGTNGGSDLRRALGGARNDLGDSLARALPEPHGALSRGILLGQRAQIPRDLTDDMNRAGISHLVAISGYNVTLVAGFAVASLAWLVGRRPAIVTAMLLVPLFALFVGGSASVLRAAVMGEVMLCAQLAGRPGSALTAVTFAAALLTLWRPVIVQDVAFQLSVAATLGIVVLAKPLAERIEAVVARVWPAGASFCAESASLTLAASLAASPIVAATFGRVSLVALVPANIVAGLLFPLVLLSTFVTALAGLLSDDLGRAVGELAYLPLEGLVQIGRIGADLPYASVSVDGIGVVGAVAGYVALGASVLLLSRRREGPEMGREGRSFRLQPALALSIALFAAAGWLAYDGWTASAAPSQLTVSVLDVGQGDATLIQTPAGLRVLVDGGPSGDRLLQALGRELPHSARRLDVVILSDARDEHAAGLVDLVERYDVGAALTTPQLGISPSFRALRDALESRDVPLLVASAGQTLELGTSVQLQVVAPGAKQTTPDAAPLVLRLVDGKVSFLLAGALPAGDERQLLASGFDLRSTVLTLPRHGAESAWTRAFIAATEPQAAVISVGPSATGMPAPSTELALRGITELRTDRNGRVRLRSDRASVDVDYERGGPRQLYEASK